MAIPNFYNALTYPNLRQVTPAETFYSAIKPYEEMKAEQQKNAMDQAELGLKTQDTANRTGALAIDQSRLGIDQAKFDKERKQDAVYMAIRDEGLPPAEMLVKMRTAAFGFGDQEGVKVADEGLKGLSQRFASIGDWKNVARVDSLATGGAPTQEGEKFLSNAYERSINPPLTQYQQVTADELKRSRQADEQLRKDAMLQRSDEQRYRRDDLKLRREAQTAGSIPGMDNKDMANIKILGGLMGEIQDRRQRRYQGYIDAATAEGKTSTEAAIQANEQLRFDPGAREDDIQYKNYGTQLNAIHAKGGLVTVAPSSPASKGMSAKNIRRIKLGLAPLPDEGEDTTANPLAKTANPLSIYGQAPGTATGPRLAPPTPSPFQLDTARPGPYGSSPSSLATPAKPVAPVKPPLDFNPDNLAQYGIFSSNLEDMRNILNRIGVPEKEGIPYGTGPSEIKQILRNLQKTRPVQYKTLVQMLGDLR